MIFVVSTTGQGENPDSIKVCLLSFLYVYKFLGLSCRCNTYIIVIFFLFFFFLFLPFLVGVLEVSLAKESYPDLA